MAVIELSDTRGSDAPSSVELPTLQEELVVEAEHLLRTIRQVIHEGNYRHIVICNERGHAIVEIPETYGLVGSLLAPLWAAIGAMAAMESGFFVIIERPAPRGHDARLH
jgi:hypothetical protein